MSRQNHKSEPLYPRKQWKADTDPLVRQLIKSNKRNLLGRDKIAWMFHIIGRLRNGLFSPEDMQDLTGHFENQAHELLSDARSHFKQAIRTLLLLRYAPDATSTARKEWKDGLAHYRVQLEVLYRNNPSMKPFTDAMIRFSWRSARANAANILSFCLYTDRRIRKQVLAGNNSLSAWNQRLPNQCPWSADEIAGFQIKNAPIIVNPRKLPFDEPETDF